MELVMPIHTNDLSAASDIALECLIRRVVDLHLAPPFYSKQFLEMNHPQWENELPGMSQPEVNELLVAAAKALQLKMEEKR
jgi:hypothetical protein